jgi:orotidine 5'-phosphate decarboxylase subfamily 2
MNYFERLALRSREAGSLLCVGLDPDGRRHKVEEIASYNRRIIEATAPYAACFKPNIAFYEQFGVPGLKALEQTLAVIPEGIPVIGDVKRGDIGSTAAAYARAMFEVWDFDAVTLHPYLGKDSIEPFLEYEDRGVYLVCRTSNPGARDLQYLELKGGRPLYEQVAMTVTAWSPRIGLVVGATAPAELRRVREVAPRASLLVPGVGAQGGDPAEAIRAAGGEPGTIVVSASRSVMYAAEGSGFAEAAAEAARGLRDELAVAVASLA